LQPENAVLALVPVAGHAILLVDRAAEASAVEAV
jgi:hypothetical protein